jgi:phage-related protein
MKKGSFIFDGVDSTTLNTFIQNRPTIESPLRKVEMKSIYAVNGDIPFDEGAYRNTDLYLDFIINGNSLISDRQKLYNLLDSKGLYKDFIPYFDPDKIYKVMLSDKLTFENKYFYGEKQTMSAKFTVKPYKYLVANSPVIINGASGSIVNPTGYLSQPIMEVKTNGDITLTINGKPFVIKDIVGTITIDSERYSAYRYDVSGNLTNWNDHIFTREFPTFKPGNNVITASGLYAAQMQLIIQPRWRSLV